MKVGEILENIEQKAWDRRYPIVGSEKGQVLGDLVKKFNKKNILEVGTNIGYSAITMAINLPDHGHITTIEIDENNAEEARENIKRAGFTDKIKVLVGPAKKILPILKKNYDMLFLDAEKEEYLDYLKLSEDKLEENSLVVADNVKMFFEEVSPFLDYLADTGYYENMTVDFGFDAFSVSIKKSPSRFHSLHL